MKYHSVSPGVDFMEPIDWHNLQISKALLATAIFQHRCDIFFLFHKIFEKLNKIMQAETTLLVNSVYR